MNPIVETKRQLDSVIDRVLEAGHVGLDTEFVWEKTYYPALGIVQLATSESEAWLIDAPAIEDLAPLGKVIADPRIVKILHDAPQDLSILRRAGGAAPHNVFDTRCAAGFLGLTSTASLSTLLKQVLNISLPKTETRTDWLDRPLTEKQIAYAMDDVRYLPTLRDTLLARVRSRGREAWLNEELAAYDDGRLYQDPNPRDQFMRVKGIGKLAPAERAILRELAAWREDEARGHDSPRFWILPDETLVRIARKKPRSLQKLTTVKGLADSQIRQFGTAIISAVKAGLALPAEQWPHREEFPNDDETLSARVDLALALLKGRGLREGIDPSLFASRAEITAVVRDGPEADSEHHSILRGWRATFLGKEIRLLLEGKLAIRVDPETGLPTVSGRSGIPSQGPAT